MTENNLNLLARTEILSNIENKVREIKIKIQEEKKLSQGINEEISESRKKAREIYEVISVGFGIMPAIKEYFNRLYQISESIWQRYQARQEFNNEISEEIEGVINSVKKWFADNKVFIETLEKRSEMLEAENRSLKARIAYLENLQMDTEREIETRVLTDRIKLKLLEKV